MSHTSWALSEFHILIGRHQVGLGVTWCLGVHSDTKFSIGGFCRFGEVKGNGAVALEQICLLADRYGITLVLTADNGQLVEKVYAPHGFVSHSKAPVNGWWNYNGCVSMQRMPTPRPVGVWQTLPWETQLRNSFSLAKARVRAEKQLAD